MLPILFISFYLFIHFFAWGHSYARHSNLIHQTSQHIRCQEDKKLPPPLPKKPAGGVTGSLRADSTGEVAAGGSGSGAGGLAVPRLGGHTLPIREKSLDLGDRQRTEARRRLLQTKRTASFRQNSATESADSIEIYIPEAQTRLWTHLQRISTHLLNSTTPSLSFPLIKVMDLLAEVFLSIWIQSFLFLPDRSAKVFQRERLARKHKLLTFYWFLCIPFWLTRNETLIRGPCNSSIPILVHPALLRQWK